MKTYKISKKTSDAPLTERLEYDYIVSSGNGLCAVVREEKSTGLDIGAKIRFQKSALGSSGQTIHVCEQDMIIYDVVLEDRYKYVYFEYPLIPQLKISQYLELEVTGSPYEYKFYFDTEHNMVPGDFDWYFEGMSGASEYCMYVVRGNSTVKYTGLALCYPSEIIEGENIIVEDTECVSGITRLFNYQTMERNSILASFASGIDDTGFTPEIGDKVLFCTNPYFFTNEEHIVVTYDNVEIRKYSDFMNVGIVLEQDYDMKRLYQEHQVNDLFVKKIKDSIIPGFLDLEKIKYAPAFFINGGATGSTADTATTVYLATGLTFNPHFRKRVMDPAAEGPGSKYVFEDVWHINDGTSEWNPNGIDDETSIKRENLYEDEEFVNSANLIGYLGFDDSDIYNQKNRVKQSFLRLSFYDSKNPLEQNLLFYSTVFMDSGDLYGKFVKRKAWLEDNDANYDEIENPVVWSSAATTDPVCSVTCQFVVNDEYDMTRSGEGFNMYLFREDAPIENEWQDIYMKVEFNHAGYGRTIPLIHWRKNSSGTGDTTNQAVPLTIGNYIDNLYINVRIMLTDNGYVYTFPDAVPSDDEEKGGWKNGIVWDNDRLYFNLFEPAIEPEIEKKTEEQGN